MALGRVVLQYCERGFGPFYGSTEIEGDLALILFERRRERERGRKKKKVVIGDLALCRETLLYYVRGFGPSNSSTEFEGDLALILVYN